MYWKSSSIMKNRDKLIYRISTGLFTLLMMPSAILYFAMHEMAAETFTNLGFPTYIIYPLAIAKILGLIAIWTDKSRTLKEWAYAGFIFDFMLASSSHFMIQDGEYIPSLVALATALVSYVYYQKLLAQPQ